MLLLLVGVSVVLGLLAVWDVLWVRARHRRSRRFQLHLQHLSADYGTTKQERHPVV